MLPHAMAATLAIVGAGRVGRALGRRLRALGWRIGAVVTQSRRTAREAVRAIRAGRPLDRPGPHVLAADIVLIATPDSAIRTVATQLARMGGRAWRGKIVLHTSGALARAALAPLARCGAATGSLHPLQTFSGRGIPPLRGIVFAIEGSLPARRLARQIARRLGGIPIEIDGRRKPAYHAAGAFAAPHILAIVETAARILMSLGFTRRQAARALLPLARQTLANYEQYGPQAAFTGPVARGDDATVARHLAVLSPYPRECRAAYAALTRLGARVLAKNPRATLRRLERLLRTS
jgi:predicted short-subunit dehydrogenase-like oxidoreductase (DUF2520 family)